MIPANNCGKRMNEEIFATFILEEQAVGSRV